MREDACLRFERKSRRVFRSSRQPGISGSLWLAIDRGNWLEIRGSMECIGNQIFHPSHPFVLAHGKNRWENPLHRRALRWEGVSVPRRISFFLARLSWSFRSAIPRIESNTRVETDPRGVTGLCWPAGGRPSIVVKKIDRSPIAARRKLGGTSDSAVLRLEFRKLGCDRLRAVPFSGICNSLDRIFVNST